ncbi:MAG: UDP-3-O-(3-hydroxymyristoyl)glucosamine N-acyltransferase [Candidatus Omnitrophica bacterium]|nr:UDP-3-O-(3-hydroxymyristoyl)glucosamine N-acyltransferase [Candidatus Omnitrophota bacterium]
MKKTLAEIAKIVNGEVVGNKDLIITGLSGIQEAEEGDLTFLANLKYLPFCRKTKASAIITSRDIKIPGKSVIRTDNPSLAFTELMSSVSQKGIYYPRGIHETACIAKDAVIGNHVSIGAFAIIESKVTIGDNTTVFGGSYIGHESKIGADCLIYPNVTIRERVTLGQRVIVHSGTVIGSDGFGYVQIDGVHKKIPQVGTVVIGDDVEIGANVAIDRARFDQTVIGRGSKIDNLVQVAHNVVMGENCIIVSQVGISGSVNIGKGAILAGQAGITGHITIGEGAVIYAQSAITKSVPAHARVSGYPARPHIEAKRIHAFTQRLPLYVKMIQDLEKKVEELEASLRRTKSSGKKQK